MSDQEIIKDRDLWADMYEEILARNVQLADELHRVKSLNPEWTADMMKALERAVKERDALAQEVKQLREALEFAAKYTRRVDAISEEIYQKAEQALQDDELVL